MKLFTKKYLTANKRKILLISVVFIVSFPLVWFGYHTHEKNRIARYESFLEAGKYHMENREVDKAILDFTGIIENSPFKEYRGYLLRAICYSLKNDYEKVLADTEQVLKRKSFKESKEDSVLVYSLRAEAYRYTDRYEEAVKEYEKAYLLDEKNSEVVNGYVGGLVVLDQNEKAYEIIKKYFEITPKEEYWDDVDAWYNRAFASYKTHRCIEAGTSAWHFLMRARSEKEKQVGEGIMHNALNDEYCIDKEK